MSVTLWGSTTWDKRIREMWRRQRLAKYQLSCSDLDTPLEANRYAAYFHTQTDIIAEQVRCTVLTPSTGGDEVEVALWVNGKPMLSRNVRIPNGRYTSVDHPVQPEIAITQIPNNAEVVVEIVNGGNGATGLITSVTGLIATDFVPDTNAVTMNE